MGAPTITTIIWTGADATNPNAWSDPSNWSTNSIPDNTTDVVIGNGDLVNFDPSIASIHSLTLTGDSTLSLAGGQLVVQGQQGQATDAVGVSVASGSTITGYGDITATDGFGGAGTILASGGTLELDGTVSSGVQLTIDTQPGSDLDLTGKVSASAIDLSNVNQTLEIGTGGVLTIGAEEDALNGAIQLDPGSTLIDSSGIVVGGEGASQGSGAITGAGVIDGPLNGLGTVTAVGGTLTINGPVDQDASGSATIFNIGGGLVPGGTLAFANTLVGSATEAPSITFEDNAGTLDLSKVGPSDVSNDLGTISNFSQGDTIELMAEGASDTYTWDGASTLTVTGANGSETLTLAGGSYNANSAQPFSLSDANGVDTITICFMAGTMIRTPEGEVAVETLKRGDLVLTSAGVAKPVSWLGVQTVSARFADPMRSWPIRVKAGALGDNMPSRDLLLSPDHALLVEGALVHAGALVNGSSVVRETTVPATFVYYHVELDDHSLILAENTPAETFVDNVDRLNFDNWAEHQALYPDGKIVEELPYPRAKSRRQVPVGVRVALTARAELIGAVAGVGAEVA